MLTFLRQKTARRRPHKRWLHRILDRLIPLLSISAPDPEQLLRRIKLMECDIFFPLKAAGIAMLLYSFYSRRWIMEVLTALDIAVETTQILLWFYIAANVLSAVLLFSMRRLTSNFLQWIVFCTCLLDGIFLSALTLVTGGYASFLYWLFVALIIRSAVSVPRATSQLMLNLTLSACYVVTGLMDISIAETLPEEKRESSGLSQLDNPAEPMLLRLGLLLLMTVCSYGVQVLLERQRQAEEEAREFAVREAQLRSAGRVAAEFAHQMKNPLAIINNAAWSLQRALDTGRSKGEEQLQIIKEEVEHSDKIITQIMGYAQLSEGRVEKLNLTDELDFAISRVFPPAAGYPIEVHKEYGPNLPAVLMQKRHLNDTLMNLLQNARDALEGKEQAQVHVSARVRPDKLTEIIIRDNGPGIPRDKFGRIFEAYYTTKEKGTGLGLATVKHNVELYGGKVLLESELGTGATFTLLLPTRSLTTVKAQV